MRLMIISAVFGFLAIADVGAVCAQIDPRVQGLSISTPLSGFLQSQDGERVLGLTEEQKTKFREIAIRFKGDSEAIRRDTELSFEEMVSKFSRLRRSFDEELRSDLLPHQVNRVDRLSAYQIVAERGLARSAVDGVIAAELELNVRERRAVRIASREALADYRSEVERIQKEAVEKIAQAIPEAKREAFMEYVELIERGDGLIWVPSTFHLDPDFTSQRAIPLSFGLPPIDN